MHEIAISFGVVFFFALIVENVMIFLCNEFFGFVWPRFLSETGLVSMAMSRANVFLKVVVNGEENCRFYNQPIILKVLTSSLVIECKILFDLS